MSKSLKGMEDAYKTGGKTAAVQYCQEWQKEIEAEGKLLTEKLKKGEIDMKFYNQRRVSINQRTNELNSCVGAINKKFS